MLLSDSFSQFDSQEEPSYLITSQKQNSVGLLKDYLNMKGIVMLSPKKVAKLTEENLQVWIQRKFGVHAAYSDLDYADAGADMLDEGVMVILQSDILVKFEAFTLEEIRNLKPHQIIVSSLDLFNTNKEYFTLLKEKEVTAFALDYIQDLDGNSVLQNIFYREDTAEKITSALGDFILPIIQSLAFRTNLRSCIQTNPVLFQSLYCYHGDITHKEVAEKIGFPWKDFVSMYWNLN